MLTIFYILNNVGLFWNFLTILSQNFWPFFYFYKFWLLWTIFTILETCDIWDTDYKSDDWEPEFMTIFVTWQLIVILDSIRNSCDVSKVYLAEASLGFYSEGDKLMSWVDEALCLSIIVINSLYLILYIVILLLTIQLERRQCCQASVRQRSGRRRNGSCCNGSQALELRVSLISKQRSPRGESFGEIRFLRSNLSCTQF